MRQFHFSLRIGPDEMMKYYRGLADKVVIRSDEGAVLHLHPRHLRPFIDGRGIVGRFRLSLAASGNIERLERL